MNTTTRRLADVAEILPGLTIPGAIKHDPAGSFQLILPRHIDEDGRPFVFDGERHGVRMTLPDRAEKYVVLPGDVLFMSRGERNRAAEIVSCPEKSIAPGTFFILRPRPDVLLPGFLAWLINQVPTQEDIAKIRTGAGTPMVPRISFGELSIPIPPIAQQTVIAHLGELMLREQKIVGQLTVAVTRHNRTIGHSIISKLSNTKTS